MAQPYISFEIISVQHEAPDPTLHKWMILIKLLTHKKLYQLLEMIKIVEGYPGEDNHTLSWSVTLSSWHVVVSRGNPVWDGSPEMAKELWVVKNEYLLKGRELFYHKRKKKKRIDEADSFFIKSYPHPNYISNAHQDFWFGFSWAMWNIFVCKQPQTSCLLIDDFSSIFFSFHFKLKPSPSLSFSVSLYCTIFAHFFGSFFF